MSTRAAAWLAWPLCLLCVTLTAGFLLFNPLNGNDLSEVLSNEQAVGTAIVTLTFSIVGALIASRHPRNLIGWLLCCVALNQILSLFAEQYATFALVTQPGSLPLGAEVAWLSAWVWFPGLFLALIFLPLLFPTGRVPSPRWRWVAWISAVPITIFALLAGWLWQFRGRALIEHPGQLHPSGLLRLLEVAVFPLVLLCGLASVISLMVRFMRSRGIEREQLKWFAYAAALTLAVVIVGEYVQLGILAGVLLSTFLASMPVAVGIAILRHRLYDIDLLINRTLVYGSLTATLIATYFGGIVVLQRVFVALTGERSTLAVVASTLIIAALFNPLRRRVQGFVDRRFYRRKYDAAKTLAAFNARLRNETDLDTLSDDLVGVARGTVQPEHASLWLRPELSQRGKQAN